MTAPDLPAFRARLTGGILRSVADARGPDHDRQDELALANWPERQFDALAGIHEQQWSLGGTIFWITEVLAASPELLEAVILAPEKVLDRVLLSFGTGDSGLVDAWIAMCWTSEAAWLALSGDAVPAEDASRIRPLAARLRFLVLSEPMRWRGQHRAWWDYGPDRNFGGSSVLGRVLGEPYSWERLVDRCAQARATWLECLDHYQDHVLLRRADPGGEETELRQILFRDGKSRPLTLSAVSLAEPATPTAADRDVWVSVTGRHLLPRFAIGMAARLALYEDTVPRRAARTGFAAAAAASGLAAVGLAVALDVHPAVYLIVACYALICLGAWMFRTEWGALWLLRMPAASAVGIVALVSFMPGGWVAAGPRGWTEPGPHGWAGAGGWHATAVLAAAAFGYLLIQARNHGLAAGTALRRALIVALIGLVHALMISVLGLTVIAPAFVQSGWDLHELWARPQYGHAGTVLALATAWCLAFGVFSQILWDDRPITATLAHLSWRK